MSNKVIVRNGVGFPGLLFIVLLVCKLFGAHSGACKKCKEEQDSITSLIINVIKDGRDNN